MKIDGNFEMTADLDIDEDLVVDGNIYGKGRRYNIRCLNIDAGNIDAGNIDALDIDALDIDALDIVALDIDARNIDALDIDAWDIICLSRKKKSSKNKTIAFMIVTNRWGRERKEVMP